MLLQSVAEYPPNKPILYWNYIMLTYKVQTYASFFNFHSVTYTDNLKVNLVGVFTAWKQQNISPSLTWKQVLIAHKWIANYMYTMNTKSLNHLNLDSFINYKSIWTPERLWVKVILICWRSVIYNNNNKNLEILNF